MEKNLSNIKIQFANAIVNNKLKVPFGVRQPSFFQDRYSTYSQPGNKLIDYSIEVRSFENVLPDDSAPRS